MKLTALTALTAKGFPERQLIAAERLQTLRPALGPEN